MITLRAPELTFVLTVSCTTENGMKINSMDLVQKVCLTVQSTMELFSTDRKILTDISHGLTMPPMKEKSKITYLKVWGNIFGVTV